MRECLVNRAAKGKKRIEITRDEANKDADTWVSRRVSAGIQLYGPPLELSFEMLAREGERDFFLFRARRDQSPN